jgi:hypothetical protein
MTHIWQSVRSGDWLSAERARGDSLILLAIAGIAMAGWIAISDGLIDRNGKPARDTLCARLRPRRISGRHRDTRALRLHPKRELLDPMFQRAGLRMLESKDHQN